MAKKTTARKTTREIGPQHMIAAIGLIQEQLDVMRVILEAQVGTMPPYPVSLANPGNPCMCYPAPGCWPHEKPIVPSKRKRR
jgi:hypothetical protein